MSARGDRDWANLPPELLGSIVESLAVEDYIRFGATCTSWASISISSPKERPFLPQAPQMPLLLLVGEGKRDEFCTLVSFHDRHCRRIGPLPEMQDKWCIGSQEGWLALLDKRSEVSLFHLLTRTQIHLPSITTIPDVIPVYNPDDSLLEYRHDMDRNGKVFSYTLEDFRCISFKKIVFSSRPTYGSYTVMAIFGGYNVAAFATEGGGKWTLLNNGPDFTDIIYRYDKFLAVSSNGELWAINVKGPSPEMTMIAVGWSPLCTDADKYLVDSSGDLLMVWTTADAYSPTAITKTIDVMKFDSEHAAWVPLKSLGDNSLFLGLCYSISLSAREISKLKPNHIYFTEVLWDWIPEGHEQKFQARDVYMFNIEDGSFDRYEAPDPRLNWPPPLWIAPSLL